MMRLQTICLLLGLSLSSLTSLAQTKPTEIYGQGEKSFRLATGSPGELGLLKILAETFSKDSGAKMEWFKAGSGASLKMLKNKEVDMIMVHAPAEEKAAVAQGWATNQTLIGSNEFYIVGPKDDPADIKNATSGANAHQRIATKQAKYVSRGDNSGTHQKELQIWGKASIKPAGSWYIVTNDFMTASLKKANVERAYFMTDSSTWVAEKNNAPQLQILYRGDKFLVNTYHALSTPPGTSLGSEIAKQFIAFVASEKGQTIIRNFGKELYGDSLYNDAKYALQYVD